MNSPISQSNDHFYNGVIKLFNYLEQVYYIKARAAGKRKSPTFEHFLNYQHYLKLGGEEEIAVVYHHFEQLYDNFKHYILADNFSWLTSGDPIILRVPEEKDKYLNLTSFIRVAESLEEISNGQVKIQIKSVAKELLDEIHVCLCRIFYSVTLKLQPNIIPEAEKEFKKDQLILLKRITPRSTNGGGDPASVLNGLIKGIDLQKTLNGGNLNNVIDKLTDNANQVLSDMNVDVRIPNAIKTKISNLANSVNNQLEKDPSAESMIKIAKEALGPKMIIEDTDVVVEQEDGEIKRITGKDDQVKVEKDDVKIEKEDVKVEKEEAKTEETARRRRR